MSELDLGQPSEKQREFFLARERFVGYGGARGGGKSWAVRVKATLMALGYAGIKILILRRTFPELRENHILPLRALLLGVARYKETEKRFYFVNGSSIIFGYCATEGDVLQYQGQEYDVIFIDEATQFTEFQFSTLTACLRGANDFPKRMYLTCNPGGVGHAWVKRLFVDRAFRADERPEDYRFIKALVDDNRVLMESDPDYVRMLDNLPTEELRRAWRYGDWSVFMGQYFTMWDETVHLVEPFPVPRHWARYLTLDYGLDMLAAYWIAVSEEGLAYVYREAYRSGLIISEAAELLREMGLDGVGVIYAPPDLWNRRQDTGKSAAEIFAECGVPLTKADNRRVQGWYDMAEWLKVRRVQPQPCSDPRTAPALRPAGSVQRATGQSPALKRVGGACSEQPGGARLLASRTRKSRACPETSRCFSGARAYSPLAEGEEGVAEEVIGEGAERYAALRIFRGCCPNLVRCLPLVQIDEKNPNDVAPEPHELTHSVDAIRYFCAGRPLPAERPKTEEEEWEEGELSEFLEYGR